jgi:hypothetical protein
VISGGLGLGRIALALAGVLGALFLTVGWFMHGRLTTIDIRKADAVASRIAGHKDSVACASELAPTDGRLGDAELGVLLDPPGHEDHLRAAAPVPRLQTC